MKIGHNVITGYDSGTTLLGYEYNIQLGFKYGMRYWDMGLWCRVMN